jgi:hypothetical protein
MGKAAALLITFIISAIIFNPLGSVGEKVLGLNVKETENSADTEKMEFEDISSPTPTPTPTPTPSPSLTPSPTSTLQPSATPVPTPTPYVVSGEELTSLFERFANEFGVDVWQLRRIADCESGFNTNARNLNYLGLFQFSPQSWKSIRQLMGTDTNPDLRVNPEEAIKTASYAISIGRSSMWPNCK